MVVVVVVSFWREKRKRKKKGKNVREKKRIKNVATRARHAVVFCFVGLFSFLVGARRALAESTAWGAPVVVFFLFSLKMNLLFDS